MIKTDAFQAHPGALNDMYGSLTQLQSAHKSKTLLNNFLGVQTPLLNMLRLFTQPILFRAPILLPIPQHIRGPSLNDTLQRTFSLHSSFAKFKRVKEEATHSSSNMPLQPLLPVLMDRMSLPNLTQTIPHQHLIVPRREQRRRHIDQDRDPAIIHIGERFAAEEDGRHDPRAKVTGQVGGDGDVGEAPDHSAVCEADGKGGAGGGDEGVRGIEAGPDYDANVRVDEELGEEEVT